MSKAMKRPLAHIVLLAACAQIAAADEDRLLGAWSGNDRASAAIYATMHISQQQINWGGGNPYNPYCKTTYTVVAEYSDVTYPDNTFPPVDGRTFTIYKLKLDPQDCTKHQSYLQFALPSDAVGYAEVVTYGRDDSQTGWHTFSKVSDQPMVNEK